MANETHPKNTPLSISQLNRQAKRLLEGHFSSVWVEGEISNLARPSSGHWYFSLKDAHAQVRCAMFRSSNSRVRFNVEAGQHIIARAKLSLYEARGDYQLIVEHIEPAGDGALAKAFEALKRSLSEQGLFDASRKKPLPGFIRHIAIVSSATGAAIRDVLTVLNRRFPAIEVSLFPVQVQGQEAARQIANAIDAANAAWRNDANNFNFDAILVTRGGGSLEDLWSFNEELVAYSISRSELPVVSAVGHEVDFTIADFVADVRAPTPSAAAELLSPDQREWLETLSGFEQILSKLIRQLIKAQQNRLDYLHSHLKHPGSRLQEHHQRLDELELRLLKAWQHQLRRKQHRLDLAHERLRHFTPKHTIDQLRLKLSNYHLQIQQLMQHRLEKYKTKLSLAMQLLNTVSPLATLDRGYAIVTDSQAHVVTDAEAVQVGQTVYTRLAKGSLHCTVVDRSNNE